MRLSTMLLPTLRELPADATLPSHVLMLRSGMIRQLAAGVYVYLPLALRSIRKVEEIVREELNRAGCQELLMPMVQPGEIWEKSGRWAKYGPELLRFTDRKGGSFCLGPTHEEVITWLFAGEVSSYRQLPMNLYQIQDKFRDEVRPRFGLMRGREFIMKDAYSFHIDKEDCLREYRNMYDAYTRIFKRCGLSFRAVEADTGAIGGNYSHEFQVLASSGEDTIMACNNCEYSANIEQAETVSASDSETSLPDPSEMEELREVHTPAQRSIEEVAAFLKVEQNQLCKTLIYFDENNKFYAVCIRGDEEVNEVKLQKALGVTNVYMATEADIERETGAPLGFAGPVGMRLPVIADYSVRAMKNFATGANRKDYHLVGVNYRRDFEVVKFADLRLAREGEPCPRCGKGTYGKFRGIEVGQVFYLGKKYSDSMGATVLNDQGEHVSCEMGCYGIGITRTVAAAIEQHHDDNGIIWPMPLSPFHVHITPVMWKDDMRTKSEELYSALVKAGFDVLLDDRDERAGVKFKDADLIGIPMRITVGSKSLAEGKVEFKLRREKEAKLIPLDEVLDIVKRTVEELMAECAP